MELQHVNLKLILAPLDEPVDRSLEPLIPLFHSWIRDQRPGDLFLDIADYRHVSNGPGVIIIGHEGNLSVDNTDGRLGVRYNRKAELDGGNQDRLRQAVRAALEACQRIEAEPSLGSKVHFGGHELEIMINDRLLAPNLEGTREAIHPELQSFAHELFAGSRYSLSFVTEPRRLLTGTLKVDRRFSASELLANLSP